MTVHSLSHAPHITQSELALLQAAQRHDRCAEAELVRRYEPLIRRIVRHLRLPDGCEREDIAQEARIGLVHAVRSWRPGRGSTFGAYAARCATNQAIKALNSHGARKHRPLNCALSLDTAPAGAVGEERPNWLELLPAPRTATSDPELALLTGELLDGVIEALPTLTPKERTALAGALNGRSHRELAAECGGTIKGSKQALRRARNRLTARDLEPLRAA